MKELHKTDEKSREPRRNARNKQTANGREPTPMFLFYSCPFAFIRGSFRSLVVAAGVAWFSCGLADAGPICNSVRSGSIVIQRNVVVQNGFAVVPFAVPVAVPVATVNVPMVLYSFDANRGYQQSLQTQEHSDGTSVAGPRSRDEGSEHWTSDSRPSAVVLKCAKCHSGEAPKAGLNLSKPAALTTKQRLAAVARVVSDDPEERMPKGNTLSPTEIGNVLQELSRSE